jgi:Holliday junction resolvase RusA-like endonuclease
MEVTIELAGIPEGKGRPRFTRAGGGIAFTPAKTRRYESALRLAAQNAMAGRPPMEGPVRCSITAQFPVPKSWSKKKKEQALLGFILHTSRPDFENLAKVVDAFKEIVWKDDSQVCDAQITKFYSSHPLLRITVNQLANGIK